MPNGRHKDRQHYEEKGYSEAEVEILMELQDVKLRLKPLERIVYGAVGMVLVSVFGALLALVVVA
jgi:hypothetical protein